MKKANLRSPLGWLVAGAEGLRHPTYALQERRFTN